jgi:hypothetical protein
MPPIPLPLPHREHVLGVAVIVALNLRFFVCVTTVVEIVRTVRLTVLTGNVIVFSNVPENVVNGAGVIVAVDVTSTVDVVVVVDVVGRVISVAVATSVVRVVVGKPSGPSRLASARASWGTERLRR